MENKQYYKLIPCYHFKNDPKSSSLLLHLFESLSPSNLFCFSYLLKQYLLLNDPLGLQLFSKLLSNFEIYSEQLEIAKVFEIVLKAKAVKVTKLEVKKRQTGCCGDQK
jgi:hypothetical protein